MDRNRRTVEGCDFGLSNVSVDEVDQTPSCPVLPVRAGQVFLVMPVTSLAKTGTYLAIFITGVTEFSFRIDPSWRKSVSIINLCCHFAVFGLYMQRSNWK